MKTQSVGLVLVGLLALAMATGSRTNCEPIEPFDPVDGGGGSACASEEDCGEGYTCYTLAPGGYCLPGAPGGPTACAEPDYPCPDGTVCSPLPWHAISGVCMAACSSTSDCRSGYVCRVVELFPGDEDTPTSPEPVCWTVCVSGMDQTCNDSAYISSLHGTCLPDGTCECYDGFPLNPETGRCR